LLKEAAVVREARFGKFKLVKTDLGRNDIDQLFRQCEARYNQDRDKLEQMMLYGPSTGCRWKILHDYFNEPFPQERCGHCDNCLHPIDEQ
jgi:ATP-dependent DNA helicase RecQ